jgi:hypothetical protein
MNEDINKKKAISHSLASTRGTHHRDREKSSGQIYQFIIRTIGAMERTYFFENWTTVNTMLLLF